MDLRTTYLGLDLSSPFMPGASPMVDDLGTVRRLEDAGAAAIVMHSLFEEQIRRERARTAHDLEAYLESFAEAASFFPRPEEFRLGPDEYLEQLRRIKQAVSIPVIASLNGVTPTGWLDHARLIEQAGADALELNVYHVATDPDEDGPSVERRVIEIVEAVRRAVRLPLAVKLSPFYTSLPSLARAIERAGVQGLVLFNRFYQPDIDPDLLEVVPRLKLSSSSELLLRIRWLAVLAGRTGLDLACSGGVHSARDAIKAVMAGATAVQTVSMLLKRGPGHLAVLLEDARTWLEQHEYESLAQARGSMSLARCPDPAAFERGNYVRILQSWSD
ncbi:MAG TPA: dihydroorotate dehydrogenase-like protein [Candidatus Acidoferrum sp.]|nr:dihydroorotate dehydrogenase-like protein [Candidatus Acidoferrum sp.]